MKDICYENLCNQLNQTLVLIPKRKFTEGCHFHIISITNAFELQLQNLHKK